MNEYGVGLFAQHQALLRASVVGVDVARERKYMSIGEQSMLHRYGWGKRTAVPVPGLLVPRWLTDGRRDGVQYRPDEPRIVDGKPRKYETPYRQPIALDVHPRARAGIATVATALWITEGARKSDALVTVGLCAISLAGVDCWQRKGNALPDWREVMLSDREVILAFDSDVMVKREVARALRDLASYLAYKGARIRYCHLPFVDDGKCGVDDFLFAHSLDELQELVRDEPPQRDCGGPSAAPPSPPPPPRPLTDVVGVFCRWLRIDDLAPLYVLLGAMASHRLAGDPVWLQVVGGSGRGKTEGLVSLSGLGGVRVVATVTPASLLSGTSRKERVDDATGGTLRELGESGVLVVKDFTSILTMQRDTRASALSALREIYDGRWSRSLGTDGGRTLNWHGKLTLIAGVTGAIDRAHAVMAIMGERFVFIRLGADEETDGELVLRALDQSGVEEKMRAELADAVRALLDQPTLPGEPHVLTDERRGALVGLVRLVARARSAVERDWQGEIELIPDPEAPTRIIKELAQLYRALGALDLDEETSWLAVVRAGLDSMPKLRRAVIDALSPAPADGAGFKTSDVAVTVKHPTKTVRRALEDLHAHGVVTKQAGGEGKADLWRMALWADTIRRALPASLTIPSVDMSVDGQHPSSDISGQARTEPEKSEDGSHSSTDRPTDIDDEPEEQADDTDCDPDDLGAWSSDTDENLDDDDYPDAPDTFAKDWL